MAFAAVAIRSRVSQRKLPLLLSASETVPMLTSDARATSRMVGFARERARIDPRSRQVRLISQSCRENPVLISPRRL